MNLFHSERLGFRPWSENDLPKMSAINADPLVMEFFPSTATIEQTEGLIKKMKKMYAEKGYCYFAVDQLEDQQFIGFIGLSEQTYEAPFTPCVDIGWRLGKQYWGRGYATEGAKRCLELDFQNLGLNNIKAVAPVINRKSIGVMEKIGMKKQMDFIHPNLIHDQRLRHCVCYQIGKPNFFEK